MHCRQRAWVGILLALAIAHGAQGGGFSAAPVRIALTPSAGVASLVLENLGDQEVLMQSQVMEWSQRDGIDVLTGSRDLLVSPPIFRIAPGAAQTLRVGLMRRPDPVHQLTYRLFLEEISSATQRQQGVSMALRLSLPVFVAPVAPVSPQLRWEAVPGADGTLKLTLKNAGKAHVQLVDLRLSLPDGALLVEQKLVTYVLGGQMRSWTLTPKQPWRGEALKLTAGTDVGETSAHITGSGR